jgi:hypothetical protein
MQMELLGSNANQRMSMVVAPFYPASPDGGWFWRRVRPTWGRPALYRLANSAIMVCN